MKRDTKRPNGTIKRLQTCFAPRKGQSSMGTKFEKGCPILHLSSSRSTGEIWTFTEDDLGEFVKFATYGESGINLVNCTNFRSPKKWGEQRKARWLAKNPQ